MSMYSVVCTLALLWCWWDRDNVHGMVHHVLLLTRLALHACGRRNARPSPIPRADLNLGPLCLSLVSISADPAWVAEAPGLPTGLLTVLDEDKNTHHPTSASSFHSHSSVDSVSSSSFFLATSLSSLLFLYTSLHSHCQPKIKPALPCLSLPQRFNYIKIISYTSGAGLLTVILTDSLFLF